MLLWMQGAEALRTDAALWVLWQTPGPPCMQGLSVKSARCAAERRVAVRLLRV